MKTLLVFLILLNLIYAGWQNLVPQQSVNSVEPLPDSLKVLTLLKEQDVEVSDTEEKLPESVKIPDRPQDRTMQSAEIQLRGDELVVSSDQCFTLGPFKDETIMRQVRDSISEYAVDIDTRKRVEEEKYRYWVYLAPKDGRTGAKKAATSLREKGVKDFYIVRKGSAKDSISLGHFKEQSGANRVLKKLKKLGFEAEIKVIYRDYDVYWLDYQIEKMVLDGGVDLSEYQSEGVSQIRRDCELESV